LASFFLLNFLFGGKQQQCDVTGPLDGYGKLALMLGAIAGNPAGQNFAALGNVTAQFGYFFIVNRFHFIDAEATDLLLGLPASFAFH